MIKQGKIKLDRKYLYLLLHVLYKMFALDLSFNEWLEYNTINSLGTNDDISSNH